MRHLKHRIQELREENLMENCFELKARLNVKDNLKYTELCNEGLKRILGSGYVTGVL